ncbi:hypothetical protein [Streptomyces sp. NPDC005262]|uniref:hypothetical protein n=1 Tax=Streptomyces sp. NPDC005262 TaxID=3364710 RepID=UPI00367B0D40
MRTQEYLSDLRARQARARQGRQPDTTDPSAGLRTVPAQVRHRALKTPDRSALTGAPGDAAGAVNSP